MSKSSLKLAIVGAGSISRTVHLPCWKRLEEVEIVAIVDPVIGAARDLAKHFDIPRTFASCEEMLAAVRPDAVDICSPNRTHVPAAIAAMRAGAHVLCEKPLAVSTDEIREMGEVADAHGRILMAAQMMRYSSVTQTLRRWIEGGNLGDVYHSRVFATRRNLIPPRDSFLDPAFSGGGPCIDIGVHALDAALYLIGFPEPVRISGVARTNFGRNHILPGKWGEWDREKMLVEDFACGQVRFADGSTMHLECSWLGHQPEDERIEAQFMGLQAGLTWPGGRYSTARNQVLSDGVIAGLSMKDFYSPDNYEHEIRAFREACVTGAPSPIPWQQSFRVMAILEGIYASARLGREVDAARLC